MKTNNSFDLMRSYGITNISTIHPDVSDCWDISLFFCIISIKYTQDFCWCETVIHNILYEKSSQGISEVKERSQFWLKQISQGYKTNTDSCLLCQSHTLFPIPAPVRFYSSIFTSCYIHLCFWPTTGIIHTTTKGHLSGKCSLFYASVQLTNAFICLMRTASETQ